MSKYFWRWYHPCTALGRIRFKLWYCYRSVVGYILYVLPQKFWYAYFRTLFYIRHVLPVDLAIVSDLAVVRALVIRFVRTI